MEIENRYLEINGKKLVLIESCDQVKDDTLELTFTCDATLNELDSIFQNSALLGILTVKGLDDERVYVNYTDYRGIKASKNGDSIRYIVCLGQTTTNDNILKLLIESIKVEDKPTSEDGTELPYKAGYKWIQTCVWSNGAPIIQWEQVVDEDYISENDGSDYTTPITYKSAMSVVKGLWYTDGSDVWECIKDGTPTGFDDKEYFDIIEG